MNTTMKPRVQAQRKFAQGAYIPPNIIIMNNTPTEHKNESVHIRDERRAAFQNNQSAKSLLDVISFHTFHTHNDPVVILERLERPVAQESGIGEYSNASAHPLSIYNNTFSSVPRNIPTEPLPIRHTNKLIKKVNVKKKTKKLVGIKKATPIKRILTSRKEKPVAAPIKKKVFRKAPSQSSSDYCLDDLKPLTFFTKNTSVDVSTRITTPPLTKKPRRVPVKRMPVAEPPLRGKRSTRKDQVAEPAKAPGKSPKLAERSLRDKRSASKNTFTGQVPKIRKKKSTKYKGKISGLSAFSDKRPTKDRLRNTVSEIITVPEPEPEPVSSLVNQTIEETVNTVSEIITVPDPEPVPSLVNQKIEETENVAPEPDPSPLETFPIQYDEAHASTLGMGQQNVILQGTSWELPAQIHNNMISSIHDTVPVATNSSYEQYNQAMTAPTNLQMQTTSWVPGPVPVTMPPLHGYNTYTVPPQPNQMVHIPTLIHIAQGFNPYGVTVHGNPPAHTSQPIMGQQNLTLQGAQWVQIADPVSIANAPVQNTQWKQCHQSTSAPAEGSVLTAEAPKVQCSKPTSTIAEGSVLTAGAPWATNKENTGAVNSSNNVVMIQNLQKTNQEETNYNPFVIEHWFRKTSDTETLSNHSERPEYNADIFKIPAVLNPKPCDREIDSELMNVMSTTSKTISSRKDLEEQDMNFSVVDSTTSSPPLYLQNSNTSYFKNSRTQCEKALTQLSSSEADVTGKQTSSKERPSKRNKQKLQKTPTEEKSHVEINSEINDSTSAIIEPVDCLSERFATVKQVVTASKEDLDKRCYKCRHCGRIDKIILLAELVRKPETEASLLKNTVLTQPVSIDGEVCPPLKKSEYIKRIDYFDLLPDSSHVIKVSWMILPNRNKPMLTACLVKRNGENDGDVSLIEHEGAIDQLLVGFMISKIKPGDTCSHHSVITPSIGEPSQILQIQPSDSSNDTMPSYQLHESVRSPPEPAISNFLKPRGKGKLVNAPVFYPTAEEFMEGPVAYFEKIMPIAAKFGLCKVVAPEGFKPTCKLTEDIRFTVTNQYISRIYTRWGSSARELSAIKAHLATEGVIFNRSPLLEYSEVNLPKLYHIVQSQGGLKNVIEKKRWSRVAEEMRFSKIANPEKKVDRIYLKYLLPYDTMMSGLKGYQLKKKLQKLLSNIPHPSFARPLNNCYDARQYIKTLIETAWIHHIVKLTGRSRNPLHRQRVILGDSDTEDDEEDDEETSLLKIHIERALAEIEECIVAGRVMNLSMFRKIAATTVEMNLSNAGDLDTHLIETAYWQCAILAYEHICVNGASVDTGEEGYGFTKNKNDPYSKHPWNLKTLLNNDKNILRYLGPVLGVTVPTLHFGMLYSTCCWHRDPHGLPWMEFMHEGPGKVWYGIPDEQSENFRRAVEFINPIICQNKSIWLPSDIAMIPPNLLQENHVSLSRVVQRPGEFIIVFPKAYSCSISTGFSVSESVYFATQSWLGTVFSVFKEVRSSCEPTMFSVERLLLSMAGDLTLPLVVLRQVYDDLSTIVQEEIEHRIALKNRGLHIPRSKTVMKGSRRPAGTWNGRHQDECEVCRHSLYFSRMNGVPSNNCSVCLPHGLVIMDVAERKKRPTPKADVEIFFTDSELKEILSNLEKHLVNMNTS